MQSPTAVIAGIDEAGRGALAGPVVAAACILGEDITPHPLIRDSKALSPKEREEALVWIEMYCQFGIGIVESEEIDRIRILSATEKAMQDAVANLAKEQRPTYLLVDGRDKFWFDYPHSPLIRGDQLEPCISAASIVAKVTRDRIMEEHAKEFSHYGFKQHKGYGTKDHTNAIQEIGLCPLHRKTFLTKILNDSVSRSTAKVKRRR